jgi:hypothetical protein
VTPLYILKQFVIITSGVPLIVKFFIVHTQHEGMGGGSLGLPTRIGGRFEWLSGVWIDRIWY